MSAIDDRCLTRERLYYDLDNAALECFHDPTQESFQAYLQAKDRLAQHGLTCKICQGHARIMQMLEREAFHAS